MRGIGRIGPILALMLALGLPARGAGEEQTNVYVQLPLTLAQTNNYTWENAHWWTNAVAQTNIASWQAWWAEKENWRRLEEWQRTNALASGLTTNISIVRADTGLTNILVFTAGVLTGITEESARPPDSAGYLADDQERGMTDAEGNSIQIQL